MAGGTVKRVSREGALRVVLCALLLVALYLLSVATQNSEVFGQLHPWLLFLNTVCLIGLGVLIIWNLARLINQRRLGQPGSRLTVRLVTMFVVLAVVPVSVVYLFSVQFLNRGIETWFDSRMEQQAMEDALSLSQASFDMRMRELLRRMETSSLQFRDVSEPLAPITLSQERERVGASELTLMTTSGRIIATSAREPAAVLPRRPEEDILLQLRQGRAYVGLDPIGDSGLHIRIIVPAPDADGTPDQRVLQGLFSVSPRVDALAESVQTHYARYQEVGYLRRPLQDSFVLTLSLVLLISLLFAVWSAFYAARRLAAPIRYLAEGTEAVAAGEYGKQLPPAGRDELGFLVRSFNDMSRRVAHARDQAKTSQAQVEAQRAYLEALLGRLSSAVLATDRDGALRTHNLAADQILGLNLRSHQGKTLEQLALETPALEPLANVVRRHVNANRSEWREQIVLPRPNGRQVLMCSGATLTGGGGMGGQVIVLDDVTALIQAQRDAAWAEVARRLAHEIKNPLTPIQLAAERMRRKCLPALEGRESEVLDRATNTIIHQVDAMKTMVNAFSDYAHPPELNLQAVDLNDLVVEVLELYRTSPGGVSIRFNLDPSLPRFTADAGRLRQLLHNLVKNALESTPKGRRCQLQLSTEYLGNGESPQVQLRVRDHGPGFSEDVLGHLFEPYVTTKAKGTGLGMPIVKKIVEEHNGTINAENLEEGAQVTIRLPLTETTLSELSTVRRVAGGERAGGTR
ncbi:nitrogen fixation/metabolism regulation signal transduction histidine kinase [Natronocella acetinitrilica]|uniref:histidine kinase n=1 Tax=Natronocella acetinitrilica TaxID=414046 RepID=A0AAE3G0P2_9GAMM|nr:ATP-binding protein [Natronocella acetinitrilica]MCP1673305.1 nitrogen fixation/metabolism regulation signal transduction histidine kinase [Natronocella acetinitrilica]